MPAVRLATRGSPQARTQAEHVANELRRAIGADVELVLVETTGDRRQDVPLHVIGGQGVFVKEVQQAVLDGLADVAVHSAKDLPSLPHPALLLGAFAWRRDAADGLVGRALDDLGPGAPVATGSVRRRAQLRAVRPDLRFSELRGNIATRLGKVPEGGSIVMAVAALQVLALEDRLADRLDPHRFVPAVGQGCVALEVRSDDSASAEAVAAVDDRPTRHAVTVERSYLAELGAGCTLPLGAYVDGDRLHAFLASGDLDAATTFLETVELGGDDGDHEIAAALARQAKQVVGW